MCSMINCKTVNLTFSFLQGNLWVEHDILSVMTSTYTDMITDDTNVTTKDDKYPWLDPDDKRRHMTDAEILRLKLNLEDSLLDDKDKEEFLTKIDDFHDVFSPRDEIGTCPFIAVHLKLKDETPFFV